ncbi:MAG TPA: hypothetical protein VGJ00_10550 [Rhabdochlamydiaceae bacterium]|jgi:lipoate-protein ligase A
MEWKIVDTGYGTAEENMRFDARLLEEGDAQAKPILHLYEWQGPSATYGHFIDPSVFLHVEAAQKLGLQLARRPTGGGIIFHIWDMAFSALVPAHRPEYALNTLDNYAFINVAVLDAVSEFLEGKRALSLTPCDAPSLDASCRHFCMANPTKYDVLWNEKKVAGAAQRKTKKGFLHQGSISLTAPSQEYLESVLLPGSAVAQAMQKYSYALLESTASVEEVRSAKEKLKALLATHLNKASLKYTT